MAQKIPVALLTGFLGSGKTLLLNALLRSPGYANTAVIVNELGEIGLDHILVQPAKGDVVLLEAGCLCCTVADSLHGTLADLYARRVRAELPPFERVVIETTGLADPAPILNTLLGHRLVTDHYRLDVVVVTADAVHFAGELERHREVAKQVALADRLVITKADLVSLPSLAQTERLLTDLNSGAELLVSRSASAVPAAFAPVDAIRRLHAYAPGERHSHDVNRHDARVRAHCFVLEHPVSWSGLAAWSRLVADSLGERLLRCKGILQIADGGEIVFIQGVQRVFHPPERLPGWPDDDHRSRLVCITRDVEEEEMRRALPALRLPPGSDPHVTFADLETIG